MLLIVALSGSAWLLYQAVDKPPSITSLASDSSTHLSLTDDDLVESAYDADSTDGFEAAIEAKASVNLLSGFVKDESGNALADINLHAYRLDASDSRLNDKSVFTKTNDQGFFQFELSDPHGYEIVAEGNWSYRKSSLKVETAPRVVLVTLVKVQGTTILGRVLDTGGKPIAGVLVTNGSGEFFTRSDENGVYRLGIKLPQTHLPMASYFRSGYNELRISIPHEEFEKTPQVRRDITLEDSLRSTLVKGALKNPAGEGLSDIRLKLHSLAYNLIYTAYSDHKGDFSFEGVRSDINYRLEIADKKPYAGLVKHSIAVTAGMLPWEFVLEPVTTVRISGTLVDGNRNPLAKFRIGVLSPDTSHYDSNIVTDGQGRFVIEEFPQGPIVFRTRKFPYFKVTGYFVDAHGNTDFLVPVDIGWHQLSGQVLGNNGIPLENARVTLERSELAGKLKFSSLRTSYSSQNGYFQFNGVNSGVHQVTAYVNVKKSVPVTYHVGVRNDLVYLVVD